MNELFDIPEFKSPRLLWMDRHGIALEPNSDSSDNKWCACMWRDGWGGVSFKDRIPGKTEDGALTALAKAAGIPLWNEESLHQHQK